MSALSSTAVQAEVLVPIDQFLANTTRHYEANQYKTSYTVYVPQTVLQGNTIIFRSCCCWGTCKIAKPQVKVARPMSILSLIQLCSV